MRSFHQILVSALFVAIIACSFIYTGCKNKCGSTTCQNGGSCTNNVCVCPQGYSGNSCQIGWSDAVIGTYRCTRSNCSPAVTGATSWQSAITKDATNGGYTVDVSNFNNSNTSVVAIVDSAQNSSQIIKISAVNGIGTDASGTVTVSSSGTTVHLHFTTYSGNGVIGAQCDMTMVKE